MEDETYEMEFVCDNCGEVTTVEIPRETLVEDFEDDVTECPNCGCNELNRL